MLSVEVCFITPDREFHRKLSVPIGTTIEQAVAICGVVAEFPNVDFGQLTVGIYSKIKKRDTILRDRDRVEIYRPLVVDPMEARRRRANRRLG